MDLTNADMLRMFEQMTRIREFDERAGLLMEQASVHGSVHLYCGEEAIAVGVCEALNDDDYITSTHRGHGHLIAKGGDVERMYAELFAKATGYNGGKGGSMHMFSKEHNFYGGHGIVGGQMPLGAGIAFAEKYKGTDNVCVCYMGDGAVRQGALNETFNMAMLWKLPVIFVCENNGYAMGTSVERTTNLSDIYKIGLGFDMPCAPVDGMDPVAVHNAMDEAVSRARRGEGPTFLEMRTYRYKGHSMSDPAKYRSKEEVEEYKAKDPIESVKETILRKKYATEAWIEEINEKVKAIVDESVRFAEESPLPEAQELYTDVYAQGDYPFIRDQFTLNKKIWLKQCACPK